MRHELNTYPVCKTGFPGPGATFVKAPRQSSTRKSTWWCSTRLRCGAQAPLLMATWGIGERSCPNGSVRTCSTRTLERARVRPT